MSGFSALPGGQRNPDGSFIGMGSFARWWSAGVLLQGYYTGTTADVYSDYISPLLDSNKFDFKNSIHFKHTSSEAEPSITYYPAGYGFSIRCIKN